MKVDTKTNIVDRLIKSKFIDLDKLVKAIESYLPDFNAKRFREVLEFAAHAHDGQMRKQEGTPYIVHPFEAATILANLHADEDTLIAALLHDVPEDTERTLEEIEEHFGTKVAYLVKGITKLSKVHYRNDMQKREVESLKNLFIHVAEDPRTMVIKLADRLHNMRTLKYIDKPEKRVRIAGETLEIYAPIASLLGIKDVQAELEELCFQILYPKDYTDLKTLVEKNKHESVKSKQKILNNLTSILKDNGVNAIVCEQQTNLYPIYKDLQHRALKIQDYQLKFYFNVLVPDKADCYQSLGIIHENYRPLPNSFEDYISTPKSNGYQSIHTGVFGGDEGISTIIQIKTHQMHYNSQYGLTIDYFKRQENTKSKSETLQNKKLNWIEEALEIQDIEPNQETYLHDLKTDIFQERIRVFTPDGKVMTLPVGSTCIDFAYSIHTDVGHRALKAKVNNREVNLSHILKKGDLVRIITTDYPKSPSYEWFSFAKTTIAKKKMKEYFKKKSRTSKIKTGRLALQKEYDLAGMGLVSDLSKWKIEKINNYYSNLDLKNLDDISIHIAEGSIIPLDLVNLIFPLNNKLNLKKQKRLTEILIDKPVSFSVKIICEPETNVADIVNIINHRADDIFILHADLKYDLILQKSIVKINMLVKSYNDISQLSYKFEHVQGVNEVRRVFWHKKINILLGSIGTFLLWALHPLLIKYLAFDLVIAESLRPFVINTALYAGFLLLYGLIFYLKRYSENNFPEIRENTRLWILTYVLGVFILSTIFMEIFLFNLHFDWIMLIGATAFTLYYLLAQMKMMKASKKKQKQKND